MNVDWQEFGIPEGYAWPRLLYNAPSKTLVLAVQPSDDLRTPARKVLLRRASESRYEEVGEVSPDTSCESVVVSEAEPVLCFNAMTFVPLQSGWSGDWEGIYRVDLLTRSVSLVIKPTALLLPEGTAKRKWVSALHSLSADGRILTATWEFNMVQAHNTSSLKLTWKTLKENIS